MKQSSQKKATGTNSRKFIRTNHSQMMPELERSSKKLDKSHTDMGATTTMTQHETDKHSMVEQLRLMKLKKEGRLN